MVGQMLSEVLLCQIFWQWAATSLPDEIQNDSLPEIRVTFIDEDCDLDVRIWNCLLNKRLAAIEQS